MQVTLGVLGSLPTSFVRLFAYLKVVLIVLGIATIIKYKKAITTPIRLWYVFYVFYFSFAILANAFHDTNPHKIVETLIPLIYFIGFSMLLSITAYRDLIPKVFAISFFSTCVLAIVFNYFNISIDFEGVAKYELNRASGVYGDANNAAVSALLSFVFLLNLYKPTTRFKRILRLLGIAISIYAVFITFSRTGLLVLFIVALLPNIQYLNFKKIFLSVLVVLPISILGIVSLINSNYLNEVQKERLEGVINIITLSGEEVNYSGRDSLFDNMYGFIEENPLLGNGLQFSNSIRGHNTIFGIWADAGILPFIIFLSLLTFYFIKALQSDKETRAFSFSILLILSIFMLSLQTIINQPYLMVLFVYVGYVIEKNNKIVPFSR